MRYIDKKLHQTDGEQIVSEFLQCIHARIGTYPEDLYKSFGQEIDDAHGHRRFRERIQTEVLEPEQGGVCCYCLRKLDGCRTKTIEHLIRNHAQTQDEMDGYRVRPTVLDELVFSKVFTSVENPEYPPFPHSIAYQNLVVSCDGDLFNENAKAVSCNLKRQNRFILPIPLYDDIPTRFVYYSNGMAEWVDDIHEQISNESVVSILGLNRAILKMIRRIWFYVADHGVDVYAVNRADLINEMYGNWVGPDFSSFDLRMLFNFKVDKYWNLFLQYDAFAGIHHL